MAQLAIVVGVLCLLSVGVEGGTRDEGGTAWTLKRDGPGVRRTRKSNKSVLPSRFPVSRARLPGNMAELDAVPVLHGPFDNWVQPSKTHHHVTCAELKLTLGDIFLPESFVHKLQESSENTFLRANRYRNKGLDVYCSPTRQSIERPRCFTDYSGYKKVAEVDLPKTKTEARLLTQDGVVRLKTTLINTADLGAQRGHNSVQCFVTYSQHKGDLAQFLSLFAFRLPLLYPSQKDFYKWVSHSEWKANTLPHIEDIRSKAILRSLQFRPSFLNAGVKGLRILEKSVRDEKGTAALVNLAKLLVKTKGYKKHAPVFDSLLGRVTGYVDATKLTCTQWYPESRATYDMTSNVYRKSFNGHWDVDGKQPEKTQKESSPLKSPNIGLDKCPLVLSHRAVMKGSSSEGSLETTQELAEATPIDGVEIDIFLHKTSNKLVVSHDADLSRVAGVPGKVQNLLDAGGAVAMEVLTGCELITPLTEFLDIGLQHTHLKFDLELKPGEFYQVPFKGYREKIGRALGRLLREPQYRPMWQERDQIVISSFDSTKTIYVNKGFKDTIRTARARHVGAAAWVGHALLNNRWTTDDRATAVIMHYSLITDEVVKKLHAEGKAVGTYTIYDFTEKHDGDSYKRSTIQRLLEAGVDWIETDDPQKLRKDLSEIDNSVCPIFTPELPRYRGLHEELRRDRMLEERPSHLPDGTKTRFDEGQYA